MADLEQLVVRTARLREAVIRTIKWRVEDAYEQGVFRQDTWTAGGKSDPTWLVKEMGLDPAGRYTVETMLAALPTVTRTIVHRIEMGEEKIEVRAAD